MRARDSEQGGRVPNKLSPNLQYEVRRLLLCQEVVSQAGVWYSELDRRQQKFLICEPRFFQNLCEVVSRLRVLESFDVLHHQVFGRMRHSEHQFHQVEEAVGTVVGAVPSQPLPRERLARRGENENIRKEGIEPLGGHPADVSIEVRRRRKVVAIEVGRCGVYVNGRYHMSSDPERLFKSEMVSANTSIEFDHP